MDPLSALGAASAVLAFVQFTGKVISETGRIYTGTSTTVSVLNDLTRIAKVMQDFKEHIADDSNLGSGPSSSDDGIGQLAQSGCEIADEMIATIDRITAATTASEAASPWQSFRQALKVVWKKKDIADLEERLSRLQAAAHLCATKSLQEQILSMRKADSERHRDVKSQLDSIQSATELLPTLSASVQQQSPAYQTFLQRRATQLSDKLMLEPNSSITDFDASLMLSRLYFEEIEHRYETIPKAHSKTFRWLFAKPEDVEDLPQQWPSFPSWLSSEHADLYWITGKPGAGKSTMMKFIQDSPETTQALRRWTGDREILMLSFFFWNSGTERQMSQEGLLRKLLHDAIKSHPELAADTFGDFYKAAKIFPSTGLTEIGLKLPDLIRYTRRLAKTARKRMKIFMLIDGLDEFKGRPRELIDLVISLQGPNTKICVSSRPWPVFEDAFAKRPSLRMEDLTQRDINAYVTAELTQHVAFELFRTVDADKADGLIRGVVEKAEGVFLWVYLVTRLLLDGMSNGEQFQELSEYLGSLPSDISALVDKILLDLESEPAKFKRFADVVYFLGACSYTAYLTPIDLSFALEPDPDFAINLPVQRVDEKVLEARSRLTKRAVIADSKCLLEVDRGSDLKSPLFCRISFLHRSVKERLFKPEVVERLSRVVESPLIDSYARRLGLARIARFKTRHNVENFMSFPNTQVSLPIRLHERDDFTLLYFGLFAVFTQLDPGILPGAQSMLLEEANRAVSKLAGRTTATLERLDLRYGPLVKPCEHRECHERSALLTCAIIWRIVEYVELNFSSTLATLPCKELYVGFFKEQCKVDDGDEWHPHYGGAWGNRRDAILEIISRVESGDSPQPSPPKSRSQRIHGFYVTQSAKLNGLLGGGRGKPTSSGESMSSHKGKAPADSG